MGARRVGSWLGIAQTGTALGSSGIWYLNDIEWNKRIEQKLGGIWWTRFSKVFDAVGGATTQSGNVEYRVFTSPTTLTVTTGSNVDILMIGGGGSGAHAGGGGGGVLYGSQIAVGVGTYSITIGSGGPQYGGAGSPTTFSSPSAGIAFTAFAGGVGGYSATLVGGFYGAGYPGGSGGGSNSGNPTIPAGSSIQTPFPSPVGIMTGYGNAGGTGANPGGGDGGGGGAGGSGAGGSTNPPGGGGAGGAGRSFTLFPAPIIAPTLPAPQQPAFISAVGPTGLYGGGGGGRASGNPGPGGAGGPGGGGSGASQGSPTAVSGTARTGGGGGGAPSEPGAGGSGIIIMRYSLTTNQAPY